MNDYWVNGTDGFKVDSNGCKDHSDCFSCPFDDCKVHASDIREKRGGRKPGEIESMGIENYRKLYYANNRDKILKQARERRNAKRRAEEARQQEVS